MAAAYRMPRLKRGMTAVLATRPRAQLEIADAAMLTISATSAVL